MNPQMLQYIQCMWHLGLWRLLQGRRNSFRCFQHILITKYISAIAGCHDFPGSRSDYAELLVDAHNLSVEFQLSLADLVELAELGPTPRPPMPPKAPNAFSHILTYSDMLGKVKGEGVWSRTIAIGVQEIHHCVASYRLRSALDKPGSKVLPWELCVAPRWWLCSRKVGETHDFLPYPPVCTAEWLFNTTSQAKPISCFSAPFLVFR